jgi:hypothetical protein
LDELAAATAAVSAARIMVRFPSQEVLMAQPCQPSSVQFTVAARELGIQDGFSAHIGGVAVDEQFVYATHALLDLDDAGNTPGVGHLVIFERATFGDPAVEPVRVPVGNDPRSVALNPNNGSVYVMNRGKPDASGQNGFSLSVVRRSPQTGAWAQEAQIKLAFGLVDVAVNAARNRVYVSNWSQHRIHVLDGVNNAELAPITDPADPTQPFRPLGIAIDIANNTLYVALSFQEQPRVDALAVIRLVNDEVQSIHRVPIAPARSQPQDVAFNPLTRRLYIGNAGVAGAAPPSVTVIDSTNLTTIATILTRAGVPAAGTSSLAVDTKLNKIYVVNAGNVQVIDGATNQISSPVDLSIVLQSIAIDRQTGQTFTGDRADGTLRRLTPLAVDTPIGQHWQANPQLGAPLAAPQPTPDGRGQYQPFEQGAIFYSSDYGAARITGPLFNGWLGLRQQAGRQARFTQADLGNLVEDGILVGDVEAARFERGMIVKRVLDGQEQVFTVGGAIYTYYQSLGDLNSELGTPISDEEDAPNGGRRQRFRTGFGFDGDVYWHPNTGAHQVGLLVNQKWQELGGAAGFLGYPTTDEQPIIKDGTFAGIIAQFEGGVIAGSSFTGQLYAVYGQILRAWLEKHGGATGHLGFPVSDEQGSPHSSDSPVRFSNFERGVLVWFPAGHEFAGPEKQFGTRVFTSLELFLERFVGDQDDASGNADLYVNKRIHASNGVQSVERMPAHGDYGTNDKTVNQHIRITDVVQGDLTISVDLIGRDADISGPTNPDGDDTLGQIKAFYSVDNAWGATEDGTYTDSDDGSFTVFYSLKPIDQPFDPEKPFRAQWWWRFDNFTTERLNTQQYADTFTDVDPGGPGLSFNPLEYIDEGWEALFYHLVYKGVASNGNCFGMALDALYAMHGRSLSSEPIFQFPRDDLRTNTINIKHAYQVGIDSIEWFLGQLGSNLTQNPVAVWHQSRDAYNRGQHPVISLTKFFGGSAHSVLPVPDGWKTDGNTLLLSVADPKEPWAEGQSDDTFQIRINEQANLFVFDSGDVSYEGGMVVSDVFGDRLFYTPWQVLNHAPTTPGPALARLLGSLFILGDAGRANQITDEQGRTFYKQGLQGPPSKWEDLRYDGGRIQGLARIPITSAGAPVGALPTELYALEGNHSLRYDVTGAAGSRYRWAVRTPATAAVLTVPASAVPDQITAAQLQTPQRSVTFALADNATSKPISMLVEGLPATARNKQFLASDLPVLARQAITARIDNGGQELLLTNKGPATSFRLQLRASPGQALTPSKQVALGGGKTLRLRPADWSQPAAKLLVEVRNAPVGPPEECI